MCIFSSFNCSYYNTNYLRCVCLLLELNVDLFARSMTLWLSLCNMPISCFSPNSSINLCNQIISLLASVATTYSTFVVESATMFYNFETQLKVVTPIVNTYPLLLLLLSLSPAIFSSTYHCRAIFEPRNHNFYFVVLLKYLIINLNSIECSFPILFIYLLTTLTACAISGLVHTISYIKLPTTDGYGTLHI